MPFTDREKAISGELSDSGMLVAFCFELIQEGRMSLLPYAETV